MVGDKELGTRLWADTVSTCRRNPDGSMMSTRGQRRVGRIQTMTISAHPKTSQDYVGYYLSSKNFSNLMRPHIALVYKGTPVTISENLPKEHVGDEIIPVMPFIIMRWFLKLLRRPIHPKRYERGLKIEEERIVQIAGKLIMSERMWQQLKAEVKSRECL